MSREAHVRFCESRGVGLPPATHLIVGFQHREDAERFRAELAERLAEFGRYAASDRDARGAGKPETFEFLGYTHICGKSRKGSFYVKRITSKKRMLRKLKEVKDHLQRDRHLSVPVQGQWLRSVVGGYFQYFAVPGQRAGPQ